MGAHETTYWHVLDDGRVQCDVCPRACRLHEGQRGLCFVRARENDAIVSTTYGRSSGYCIDAIEKKPLNHFLPGTPVLSFGTAGCNLTCKFCQNWDISKSRDVDTLADAASPQAIAEAAVRLGCTSVAFTYNDPVVFLEYAVDTALACRAQGIRTVGVTAGYIEPGPRAELFGAMDAINIDLKGFTEEYYHKVCGGHLDRVLETIEWAVHESPAWIELTTLVVPGHNDSDAELTRMARWVIDHVGPDVPMHFSAFHPDWKMLDVPPTPPDARAGAADRDGRRCALRLYGKRPRPGRGHHVLPVVPDAGHRAGLVRDPAVRPRPARCLPYLRNRDPGGVRGGRGDLGQTPVAGDFARIA
ncbi:MAG: AmmeMemoRadiSam system radical SAM enzyme [Candidatus Nanopelagicales bacterium]